MSDTSRLIKESRRIVDASNDVNLNSGTLLNMILEIVTGIDSTMRRMETSMEKRLDDLKQDFLAVSARVRTLENQASDVNNKLSDCETSCQGVSNLFDQVSGQVKTNRRNINNHDTRIKKLEDNTIVRPGVPPVINSKEIESLKAAILDLQCRTKGDNRRAPIVARFLYHRDLEYVLANATRLKGRPYGIREQFPHEIEQKRKELYPVLKQAKQQNRQASLVRDRLYIDNQLYIPDTVLEDTRTEHTGSSSANHDTSPKGSYSSDTPPSKRQRQGPSPRPPHTDDSPNSGR
ncbi:unnamed protein product [Mytilus edulis]|uniref:Uncharacterized protein n=1 Tax=Mytilus edulis TaxID=6550 RepID=A0A8S3STR4_MYTED|nr:unnamed protein product [Mytilus edulis]